MNKLYIGSHLVFETGIFDLLDFRIYNVLGDIRLNTTSWIHCDCLCNWSDRFDNLWRDRHDDSNTSQLSYYFLR